MALVALVMLSLLAVGALGLALVYGIGALATGAADFNPVADFAMWVPGQFAACHLWLAAPG